MRRYSVRRRGPIVEFILESLRNCGVSIINEPDPQSAPFEIDIELPTRERLQLICYAFLANKYRQRNRPDDEHRFQVKYGSDFGSYHRLFIANTPGKVTLMFGVHLEEKLFVAVDPAMHERTRFSRSVEFKTPDLAVAQESGWHGWERDRSRVRRRVPPPMDDVRTEVLLALRPENFVHYIELERQATGIDPGMRLLLIESLHSSADSFGTLSEPHPLEATLGLSSREILDMIDSGAFRLKSAVFGRAAEHQLGKLLKETPGISEVLSIDKDGQPDFQIAYKNRPRRVLVECKNVLRKRNREGHARVDFQKTRAAKNNPCSRYYGTRQFDILAACLFPVTEAWRYQFCRTSTLTPHPECEGRLSQKVLVSGPSWVESIDSLLDELTMSV